MKNRIIFDPTTGQTTGQIFSKPFAASINPCGEIKLNVKKIVSVEEVAEVLYEACQDRTRSSEQAYLYVKEKLSDCADCRLNETKAKDAVRRYKQSGKDLEKAAQELLDAFGCQKCNFFEEPII